MSRPQNQSQPWKAIWPPAATAVTNPNLNVVCASKGAQPHETKYADGTNVVHPDNLQSFRAELQVRTTSEQSK